MGMIGCLGDIVFTVSSDLVRTVDNLKWSGSARYATHQRHGMRPLTEFVGLDPDKITFDMVLLSALGVDPMEEVKKLWKYERNGTAVPLTLGDHAYGYYRWNIVSHDLKAKAFDRDGNIISATVSVSLQEYLRT